MIHVLATVTLAPGTRAQFLEVFNGNVPAVHDPISGVLVASLTRG